jgi:hypothetical protein
MTKNIQEQLTVYPPNVADAIKNNMAEMAKVA